MFDCKTCARERGREGVSSGAGEWGEREGGLTAGFLGVGGRWEGIFFPPREWDCLL